ncbi:DUF7010 family protein [Sinomicrobium soli]|uniref:DUF7010 family protein n=1 Tax=Sinomicrobium sp. N-1-3-6 TaxID=2219864 RepID=UPI000DCDB1E4|nr:hypothetical protein [Sinomicrobium sp. N-1-3-6]RAV28182.1 hypothetical protein DN748_14495 [Sinomicrobium sp. N-1-3-6]
MTDKELDTLRNQLSVASKNGIDFILAGIIIWAVIALVWTLDYDPGTKSIFAFIAGGPLLPLAFLFSRILGTNWKIRNNPLQRLGLWLNFAQLFYFPILFYVLIKTPDYFIMVYAIITGAHLFPYSWFYNTKWYAVFAGIIALGSLIIGLYTPTGTFYSIGMFTSTCLCILWLLLFADQKRKRGLLNQ